MFVQYLKHTHFIPLKLKRLFCYSNTTEEHSSLHLIKGSRVDEKIIGLMQKLSLKFLLILKTIPVCSSAAVLSDESHLIISNLLAPEMAPKHCETAGVVLCANTLTHHVLTG